MRECCKKSPRWATVFRLTFLAVSIGVLIRIVDFKLVFEYVKGIPLIVLGVLVLIGLIRIWLNGVRWQLVNPDTSVQLSRWQYFRLMMISHAFNLIMPGALGGDFAKMAMTVKTVKARRIDNLIAIVADRFIGLFSITVLGATALCFISDIPDRRAFYGLFGLLSGGFAIGLIAAGNKWLLRQLETLFSHAGRIGQRLIHILEIWREALQFFKHNYHQLLFALLLCLPIHGLSFLTTYILSQKLGMEVSFFDVSAVLALVWVITAVPLTISGAGVRELSLIYFLSLYGVEKSLAVALSVYLYIVSVIIGFIGLAFLGFNKESPNAEEKTTECRPV